MTNDIDKIGDKYDKNVSDIDKGEFDDVNDIDNEKSINVKTPEIPKIDNSVDYAVNGYTDLEEAVVLRKVSDRTLRRDIDELLKEIGLTWDRTPEEISAKTKKIIKRPVKGFLGKKKFKWDMANLFLDELDRKHRREKVVYVKEVNKTKDDIVKEVDKKKELPVLRTFADKIKTALKWQGLRHEGDVRVFKKEIEIKEKIITEQKKELKKKEEKIIYLTGMGGRAEGKAELLLEENEKLRGQLRLSPGLRDTTAGEGSFRKSEELKEEEIKKEENNE